MRSTHKHDFPSFLEASSLQICKKFDGNCQSGTFTGGTLSVTVESVTSLPKVIWQEGRVAAL